MDFEQPAELKQRVTNLASLGYLRRVKNSYAVGNQFLQAWLTEQAPALRTASVAAPPLAASPHAMRAVFARQREGEAGALALQLNQRRDRLVELEIVRGQELLATSPQVLSEIAQLETEIHALRRLWQARRRLTRTCMTQPNALPQRTRRARPCRSSCSR